MTYTCTSNDGAAEQEYLGSVHSGAYNAKTLDLAQRRLCKTLLNTCLRSAVWHRSVNPFSTETILLVGC